VRSWQEKAAALAADIAGPGSRWDDAVRRVARHVLVPRWFTGPEDGSWEVADGPADEAAWLDAAYDPARTLVTRIGAVHADHARPRARYRGRAASSATLPRLVLDMYRRARLHDKASVLDVGTGSGYGTALLAARLRDGHVTSIDIDPYLTHAAAARLDRIGLRPRLLTCDASGELPGMFDRIVPMVSLPGIPASWLTALHPGGRLVFSLTGGSVLITADKTPDGGAAGRVEYERAAFMPARHGPGDPPAPAGPALDCDGDDVTTSPYPVVDPAWGWELNAVLSVTAPGLDYRTATDPGTGITTTWITHPDGSWARAASRPGQPATIHQSGPRRLWDTLDAIRTDWLNRGYLPLRGASARIDPDGTCHLSHDGWHATIAPASSDAALAATVTVTTPVPRSRPGAPL
jgi:protein-L-isoaspartate O-methyltransferase